MIDHLLGRPSVKWKRSQIFLVLTFWFVCLRFGPSKGPLSTRKINAFLRRFQPWQVVIGTLSALYAVKHSDDILGLSAPEPLAHLYSPSYYRSTYIATALDCAFATCMNIKPKFLRDLMSLWMTGVYLIWAGEADENLRKFRATCTVDFLRITWEKTTNPYIRFFTKWGPRGPPRGLGINKKMVVPRLNDTGGGGYRKPILIHLYFPGTALDLITHKELILDIPGGGFVAMDPRHHEDRLIRWAFRTGRPVVSVDYRKAPEYPYPYAVDEVFDLYRALIQSKGSIIGMGRGEIDIVVTGDSAGANIATAMVYKILESPPEMKLPPPVALIYAYAALDFNFTSWMRQQDLETLRLETFSSNINHPSLVQQKDHMSHRSPLIMVNDVDVRGTSPSSRRSKSFHGGGSSTGGEKKTGKRRERTKTVNVLLGDGNNNSNKDGGRRSDVKEGESGTGREKELTRKSTWSGSLRRRISSFTIRGSSIARDDPTSEEEEEEEEEEVEKLRRRNQTDRLASNSGAEGKVLAAKARKMLGIGQEEAQGGAGTGEGFEGNRTSKGSEELWNEVMSRYSEGEGEEEEDRDERSDVPLKDRVRYSREGISKQSLSKPTTGLDDHVEKVNKADGRSEKGNGKRKEEEGDGSLEKSSSTIGARLTMTSRTCFFNDRIISPSMMRTMALCYVGPKNSPDLGKDYMISPIVAPASLLEKLPPVYLTCGERDPFGDDTLIFAGRIRQAKLARKKAALAKAATRQSESSQMNSPVEDDPILEENEKDWTTMRIYEGWSHGYLQMIALLPEAEEAINLLADYILAAFAKHDESKRRRSPKPFQMARKPVGKSTLQPPKDTIAPHLDSSEDEPALTFSPKRRKPQNRNPANLQLPSDIEHRVSSSETIAGSTRNQPLVLESKKISRDPSPSQIHGVRDGAASPLPRPDIHSSSVSPTTTSAPPINSSLPGPVTAFLDPQDMIKRRREEAMFGIDATTKASPTLDIRRPSSTPPTLPRAAPTDDDDIAARRFSAGATSITPVVGADVMIQRRRQEALQEVKLRDPQLKKSHTRESGMDQNASENEATH